MPDFFPPWVLLPTFIGIAALIAGIAMPAIEGFKTFDPATNIPSLQGKVIFVTGGTAGLGQQSVEALAAHNPAHIYFSGRNVEAGQKLIAEMKRKHGFESLTFVEMDLSSLASVKTAIRTFSHDRLDVLMCNAGIMAKPPGLSKDGYEIQFATNHLGHAMLIKQLLPVLTETAKSPNSDVRIVSNTSEGWALHPKGGVLFSELKTTQDSLFGSWTRYGQSKVANVSYARELAKRYPNITSVCIHPGVVQTGLVDNLKLGHYVFVYVTNWMRGRTMMDPKKGSYSQLWAAAGGKKSEMVNGAYYMPIGVMANGKLDATAKSDKLAGELWDWTNKTLADY